MRRIYLFTAVIFLLAMVQNLFSQTDTILIDFGAIATPSVDPWNNFTDSNEGSVIENLKNMNNLKTYMSATITDRFTGVNENGTTTPGGTLKIVATASRDNFYGNIELWSGAVEPTAAFRFSGFNKDKEYTFVLYASRMGVSDNRETKYRYTGFETDSVYLDPANNENLAASFTVRPADDGTIDLELSPGENNNNAYHFYYLGALKIIYEKEDPIPPAIQVKTPDGGEDWFVGSEHSIEWTAINLTEDIIVTYSANNGTSWIDIDTVSSSETGLSWTIPDAPSTECLVKVFSGFFEDVSDAVFTISVATEPGIKLDMPNGGEEFVSGSIQYISWAPNLLTEDITVSYSIDNGSTWTIIGTVGPDESKISWTIPDMISSECLVRVESGAYSDTSAATFSITGSICSNTIVVLGSSTAAGTGPNPIDSAWVWRYSAALETMDENYEVVNLAMGGYNTFQILPTGTELEPGITETIDVNRNINKALTYSPYAVIVNMPSNDANKGYSEEQTLENLKQVYNFGNAYGVRVWIATTQPRNFTDPALIEIQKNLFTEIQEIYGPYSIDFWTGIADENNKISSEYDSGDGVHLNNAGHRILFDRVLGTDIHKVACLYTDVNQYFTTKEAMVFPNPVTDNFVIRYQTESSAKVTFRFYDLTGRIIGQKVVYENAGGSYEISFNRSDLETGNSVIVGVIQVDNAKSTSVSTAKIILQRK